ncbi:pyridoxamine 5'-phosphate oxidase family protein, partial [Salipiger sp. HF18]|uniref:pyridoxamine 5'-phosphate oxidase family protein n=1 Tax=Salipiger sp. HF18 TaxID=2721557 RepID=UPI00142E486E
PPSPPLATLWNAFPSPFFPSGLSYNSVQLVKFTPHEAEVWAGDGGASFLYQIAKANLTGDTPDVGDHGRVVF